VRELSSPRVVKPVNLQTACRFVGESSGCGSFWCTTLWW